MGNKFFFNFPPMLNETNVQWQSHSTSILNKTNEKILCKVVQHSEISMDYDFRCLCQCSSATSIDSCSFFLEFYQHFISHSIFISDGISFWVIPFFPKKKNPSILLCQSISSVCLFLLWIEIDFSVKNSSRLYYGFYW